MTMPVENDGSWNIYKDIVLESQELENDIRKLHGMVAAAVKHYELMYEQYCELPGWELLHAQISMTLPWQHEILLAVLPEGEQ